MIAQQGIQTILFKQIKHPKGYHTFLEFNSTMDQNLPSKLSSKFSKQHIVRNSVLFCHKRGEMGWILSWHSACEVSRRSQLLFLGLGKRFGDKTATLKSTTQFLQTRQTTSLTPNSRSSSRKEMRWERETDLCTYLQLKVVKEATWLKHTHSNDEEVYVVFRFCKVIKAYNLQSSWFFEGIRQHWRLKKGGSFWFWTLSQKRKQRSLESIAIHACYRVKSYAIV